MKIWIDPPNGWRYGFPKIYNTESGMTIMEWLVSEGYPQKEIDYLGRLFYMRQWKAAEDDQP